MKDNRRNCKSVKVFGYLISLQIVKLETVKIAIDENKKRADVAAIESSEMFKDLLSRAASLRAARA